MLRGMKQTAGRIHALTRPAFHLGQKLICLPIAGKPGLFLDVEAAPSNHASHDRGDGRRLGIVADGDDRRLPGGKLQLAQRPIGGWHPADILNALTKP